MSKMKEAATILGVEIWEEFKVTGMDNYCRITDSRFESISLPSGEWVEAPARIFYELFTRKRKIIRKPWKPKHADVFYSVWVDGKITSNEFNSSNMVCMSMYAIGNCFRTSEEAEEHKEELTEKLRKIYNDGTPLIGADECQS